MKFQSQPNMWSCSVTSAAMAMDEPVQDLIARIGHDGSEIVFPDLPEPICRAGFAMQEIIDAALAAGWSMTPIEAKPECTPNGPDVRDVFPNFKERMDNYFKRYSGLVAGERLDGRYWHNVAWDHETKLWLDPSGPVLPRERPPIKVTVFWIFMKNEHNIANSFLQGVIKRISPQPEPYDVEIEFSNEQKSLLSEPVKIEPSNEPIQYSGPRRFS